MKVLGLILVIIVSVGSKFLWPYLYELLYFQGNAIAWVLLCGYVVYLIGPDRWPRKIALVMFWWAVNDVVEMCFMDRTAFDWNEYICALLTVIIILFTGNGGRKKRTRHIRNTGSYAP